MHRKPLHLSIGERAQLKIARQSLRMDAQFARWTGMPHEQAQQIIESLTGTGKQYQAIIVGTESGHKINTERISDG